jgi:hypothetical protein
MTPQRQSGHFDTDTQGLLIVNPTMPPLSVKHEWSSKGRGKSIDVATKVVRNRIEARFAANGIGNSIQWENFRAKEYTLSSLVQGLDFSESTVAARSGTLRVTSSLRLNLHSNLRAGFKPIVAAPRRSESEKESICLRQLQYRGDVSLWHLADRDTG